MEQGEQVVSGGLEECLKLLRGERDEQRLAGLLLVTKFCNKEDYDSIRKVYDALGVLFLDRLLHTGMGKGHLPGGESDNRDAYLCLSISVLAAFCRVPDIAASAEMVSKIPVILQVIEKELSSSLLEECYEVLFLISSACDDGVTALFDSGGLKLLASHLPSLPDGSQVLEFCMKLVQLILSKISHDTISNRHLPELLTVVALHNVLRATSNEKWPVYIRSGVVDILQNRVAPDQKLQALIVAESMVSMLGEGWLVGQMNLPDLQMSFPSDRCLLLVLEMARVEIAVLLNELAYLKYEASSSNSEALTLKRRNLAIAFSLVEKIIKLISNLSEDEGGIISEGTFTNVISALDEILEVVLEYVKDAKEHGQKRGDDLLASVRVAGSYLAQAPFACKEKVKELLGYMLSVECENEPSPFLSTCFLLPMLCQTTMKIEGVKVLAYCGGYKAVINCLVQLVGADPNVVEDNGCVFLACDTIMNFLLKREQIQVPLDESAFVHLLKVLTYWTDGTCDLSIIMMASSICSLIFDKTSEEDLLRHPEIDVSILRKVSYLIARSLATHGQEMCDDSKSEADLHQIIAAGYARWANRFPLVREAVER